MENVLQHFSQKKLWKPQNLYAGLFKNEKFLLLSFEDIMIEAIFLSKLINKEVLIK